MSIGVTDRWTWFVHLLIQKRIKLGNLFNDTPCWEWQGYLNPKGYGQFYFNTRSSHMVHHWMYETFRSTLGTLVPDHLCKNKQCCNPWHLQAVTLEQNSSQPKEYCKNGHKLELPNLYVYGKNRQCRQCAIERAKRNSLKKVS